MENIGKLTKNPYSIQPASGARFYGRKDEIKDILGLGLGTNGLIIGARRSGITSLLLELKSRIKYKTYHSCTYFSASKDPEGRELWTTINDTCMEDTQMIRLISKSPTSSLLEKLSFINKTLKTISAGKKENRFFFILIDKAELLEQFDDSILRDIHRSFLHCNHIKWVLAGGSGICKLNNLQEKRSWLNESFFSDFITTRLGRLSDPDTEALILQKDADGQPKITAEKSVITDIREHSYNQPYIIQLLCMKLFNAGKLNPISKSITRWVYQQCESHAYFMDSFKNLDGAEMEILLETVDDKLKDGLTWEFIENKLLYPTAELEKAVDRLIRLCFLKEAEKKYEPATPFLKKWLRSNRPHLKKIMSSSQAKPLNPPIAILSREDKQAGVCTLSWAPPAGWEHEMLTYELEEANNPNFDSARRLNVGEQRAFEAKAPGTYYYRVRAVHKKDFRYENSEWRALENAVDIKAPAIPQKTGSSATNAKPLYFVLGIFSLLLVAIFVLALTGAIVNLWLYVVGGILLLSGLYVFVMRMTGVGTKEEFLEMNKRLLTNLPKLHGTKKEETKEAG